MDSCANQNRISLRSPRRGAMFIARFRSLRVAAPLGRNVSLLTELTS